MLHGHLIVNHLKISFPIITNLIDDHLIGDHLKIVFLIIKILFYDYLNANSLRISLPFVKILLFDHISLPMPSKLVADHAKISYGGTADLVRDDVANCKPWMSGRENSTMSCTRGRLGTEEEFRTSCVKAVTLPLRICYHMFCPHVGAVQGYVFIMTVLPVDIIT